jgi:hypothetical protein
MFQFTGGCVMEEVKTKKKKKRIELTAEEAATFIRHSRGSGAAVGFGVWLILIGAGGLVLFGDTAHGLGLMILLGLTAIAVGIFILAGSKVKPYEKYTRRKIVLDDETKQEFKARRSAIRPVMGIFIALGVMVILAGVGLFIWLIEGANHMDELPAVAVLLTIIGGAVFLFINAGYGFYAYDVLLNKGEYRRKREASWRDTQVERIIGMAAAIVWPAAMVIFVLTGAIGNLWHINWIVWPIAGVSFGALCAVTAIYYYYYAKKPNYRRDL